MLEVTGRRSMGLFPTCFTAIVATSFAFVLRAMVIDAWGAEFALTETQKGELLGVGLWPFAISIVLLSLVVDRIGFRVALGLAAVCHVVGLVILLTAAGYWPLWLGTFVMSLGNGAVEAAANPAIATAYAHDKPRWLNRLHAAWPGGLVLGGLLAIMLGDGGDWRIKVALTAAPILAYSLMLLRTPFPPSERVASGVSYRDMLAECGYLSALVVITLAMLEIGRLLALPPGTVLAVIAILTAAYAWFARAAGRPLYVMLVLLMIPLATTELSTDSWISSLMAPQLSSLGLQPGWVLVYTSAIMFVLRLSAGPALERLRPLGLLAVASAATAAGIFLLSAAQGVALLAAATLYGAGKSFFWGTSLGFAGEQTPKGGAVALNVMAGAGMLAAGVIGAPLLGYLQDRSVAERLVEEPGGRALLLERPSVLGRYLAPDPARVGAAAPPERERLGVIVEASKQEALRQVALLPALMLAAYLALIALFRRRGGDRRVTLPSPGRVS